MNVNLLQHIVEPSELLLTWQPADEASPARTRRVVGVVRPGSGGKVTFEYLNGTADFEAAQVAGFQGFPTFNLSRRLTNEGVLEALLRRLPPRKRLDFREYLAQHCLPYPFEHSDLALLGYTGARLPSDGFGLVPVFPFDYPGPCDVVLEVAGVRHTFTGNVSVIRLGDAIGFRPDPSNQVDSDAVQMVWRDQPLGYVNRVLRGTLTWWITTREVRAEVVRVGGSSDRPLVFVRVSIAAAESAVA